MEQRHRKPADAREMFAVIEKYLTSALSQIAFCKQEGLPYSRFNYWLKQYRLREVLSQQAPTPMHTTTNETPADCIPLRITPAEPYPLGEPIWGVRALILFRRGSPRRLRL